MYNLIRELQSQMSRDVYNNDLDARDANKQITIVLENYGKQLVELYSKTNNEDIKRKIEERMLGLN